MSSNERRAAGRRRAWGRGPTILRFEPLEGRELLSGATVIASSMTPAFDSASQAVSTALNASTPGTTIATSPSASTSTNAAATASALTSAVTSAASSGTLVSTSGITGSSTVTPASSSGTSASSAATGRPDLVAASFTTPTSLDWGDSFTASGSVQNQGTAGTTTASELDLYAATTTAPGANSVVLAAIPIPSGLAAGATFRFSQSVTAPAVPIANLGTSPTYFLDAVVAPAGTAAGTATTAAANTNATGGAVINSPVNTVVTVASHAPSLLSGSNLTLSSSGVAWGGTLTVTTTVLNSGEGDAPATDARVVLTPQDRAFGGNTDYTLGTLPVPAIAAGQSATVSQTFTLPAYAPSQLANETAFDLSVIQDADHAATPVTNPSPTFAAGQNLATLTVSAPAVAPSTPAPAAADLKVASVTEPSTEIDGGSTFVAGTTIENTGAGDAGPFKVEFLLSSAGNATSPAVVLGEVSVPGLKAGFAQDVFKSVTLPYDINGNPLSGTTAEVIAQVDPDHAVSDSNPANNSLVGTAVTLGVMASDGTSASDAHSLVTYADRSTTTVATPAPNASSVENPVAATATTAATTATATTATAATPSTPAATRKANAVARAQAAEVKLEAQKVKLQAQIQAHYAKLQAQKVARASIPKYRATNAALKVHKA